MCVKSILQILLKERSSKRGLLEAPFPEEPLRGLGPISGTPSLPSIFSTYSKERYKYLQLILSLLCLHMSSLDSPTHFHPTNPVPESSELF